MTSPSPALVFVIDTLEKDILLIHGLCDGEAGDGLSIQVAGGRVAELDGGWYHIVRELRRVAELRVESDELIRWNIASVKYGEVILFHDFYKL